jgi:5'-nucleotidase
VGSEKIQILLTNDDGIRSPGLWAAASTLSELGFVQVVAPRDQFSGAGRSLPSTSDGTIRIETVKVNGNEWQVYSVGGSPAQAVMHGVLEISSNKPDLIVSGINFGENIGEGITASGTVGAALQGAAMGIPALAVSLETAEEHHLSYSDEVDFSCAAHITNKFSQLLLNTSLPPDVHVLKLDIPAEADLDTPWQLTRLAMENYFEPLPDEQRDWTVPGGIGYRRRLDMEGVAPGTDLHALVTERVISVTPLSLDMTSRINMTAFEQQLRKAVAR